MVQKKKVQGSVSIPEGVEVSIENGLFKAKGVKGEVSKRLSYPGICIEKKEGKIALSTDEQSKKGKRIINTFKAHMNNLFIGVTSGFMYTLKICSGHFPMTVKVDGDRLVITNFLGEKKPRVSRIVAGTSVVVKGDIITVEAIDIEAAGQTAANIEKTTKIKGRDRHVFQDGCYVIEKPKWK